jgi:nucleolar protein 12
VCSAQHNRQISGYERASSWHQQHTQDDADNATDAKKIASINREFHPTADALNAYLVFAHASPQSARPANLPPLLTIMDPYEAAREAAGMCEGE